MTNATKIAVAGPSSASARHKTPTARERGLAGIQRWGLAGVLLLVIAGFSLLNPDEFATTTTATDIINAQAPAILIAFAAMLVLVSGEFDLSLGATLGLSQYLVLELTTASGFSWPLAVVATLTVGLLVGLVNAAFVVGLGINSFIATIGVSTVLIGIIEWMSDGNAPIFEGAPQTFLDLAQTEVAGITLAVFYALLVAVVLWLVLEYSVPGRELRAAGANRRAAMLSGLRTKRAVVAAFVVAGGLCALGGILITARVGAADATSGPGYLLPAYAAAFLGATAVRPGHFNVWGTVIAIFLVAVGITGLQLQGAESWVTPVFNGVVLLLAVTVSMLATRRRQGRGG
jgi:ribose transport system permease protein